MWSARLHVSISSYNICSVALVLALAAVTSARANGSEQLVVPGWLLPAESLHLLFLFLP